MKRGMVNGITLLVIALAGLQSATCGVQDCEPPHHRGAGVLPYALDRYGEIQLLLGYQQGRGWTNFGGGPKQVETVIQPVPRCETRQETALREGVEELRFLISRSELKEKLNGARYFPETERPEDFTTFVIPIDAIDLTPYYSTPVLARSDYTETTAVGWVSLRELIALARRETNHISTPNGEPLWPVFWHGLKPQLLQEGAMKRLFATERPARVEASKDGFLSMIFCRD